MSMTPYEEKRLEIEEKRLLVEEKKQKSLETIASSLDALSLWFEEIDKDEWGERIQYYLSEFHEIFDLKKGNE